MTIETKQTSTETKTEEQSNTDPQLSKLQPTDQKKIAVDIAPGVSVELDLDTAKKVITHRDSRAKGFKEMEAKVKDMESVVTKEKERAEILEKLKTGAFEEAEVLASKKANDTLAKWKAKLIDKELTAALASNGDFIGGEAAEDAIKLIKADYKLEINDDGVVTGNEKAIKDLVVEFLGKKEAYRKAKIATGTGAKTGSTITQQKKAPSAAANISVGLGKFISGGK